MHSPDHFGRDKFSDFRGTQDEIVQDLQKVDPSLCAITPHSKFTVSRALLCILLQECNYQFCKLSICGISIHTDGSGSTLFLGRLYNIRKSLNGFDLNSCIYAGDFKSACSSLVTGVPDCETPVSGGMWGAGLRLSVDNQHAQGPATVGIKEKEDDKSNLLYIDPMVPSPCIPHIRHSQDRLLNKPRIFGGSTAVLLGFTNLLCLHNS